MYNILDDFSTQFIIRLASLIEIVCSVFFLTLSFQKKHNFKWKLCLIIILSIPFVVFIAILASLYHDIFPGVATFFIYLFIFYALYLLYNEDISELLLCLCGGLAIQMIVGRLFEILLIISKKNPYDNSSFFSQSNLWRDWVVYFLLHFIFIIFLAFLFRRKKVYEHDKKNKIFIVAFSLPITVIGVLVSSFSRVLEGENTSLDFVIRIFSILYGLLTLLLRTRILETSKLKQDLNILDELLHSEKKQFESMRDEIEIINMKYHDLKQQLATIGYKLTQQELEALNAAIEVYDTSIKTGSSILDVILYKKQLYCDNQGITLNCMADGKCLSFISSTHLYSLLSNAIENAIEAVQLVENNKKRIIDISIGKDKRGVSIHIINYYEGNLIINNDLPETNKKDKVHHGFGIKSMRYIAEQYEGAVSFHTEDDIFYLHIHFPTVLS